MTADEMRKYSFEALPEGGYSEESVDAFVESTAKAYDELFEENKEIVRRLTIFAKKLDEYKRNESYMTETLLTAQKTAAQTIAGAESVVAKMIDAAKNEGKKIINDARERSNEIYVDRDKVIAEAEEKAKELTEKAENALAEATAAAEKEAQVILDNANAQAKATVDGAKAGIQRTIDDINANADTVMKEANDTADKIVNEAVGKAQATVDAIIADANKAKAEGEYKAATEELAAFKEAETEKLNTYRGRIETVRKEIAMLLSEINGEITAAETKTEDLVAEYNSEEGISV